MKRIARSLAMTMLLLLAGILAGCGGGGGGSVLSGAAPAPGPSTGAVQVDLQFDNPARVLGRIPLQATAIVIHLVDPATGLEVVPPVTVQHTPGSATPETVTIENVPPGNWRAFLEIQPNMGFLNQAAVVQAGGTTVVEAGDPQGAVRLTVAPASLEVPVGSTSALAATLELADGSTLLVSSLVTWTSQATGTATVSSTGVVTGVSSGLTTVEASYQGAAGSAQVLVAPQGTTLEAVDVTPAGVSLRPGQTQQYTATGRFSNAATLDLTAVATWASSNTNFATVSTAGLATAVAQGDAQVQATYRGITGQTLLSVLGAAQPTSWTVRARDVKRCVNGVAYGNGLYVEVDSLGQARTSTNGLDWSAPATVFNGQALNDLAFGGGLFMAVGVDGNAYASVDGVNWAQRDLNAVKPGSATNVAFGNDVFVVTKATGVARRGALLYSSQNTNVWTVVEQHDLGFPNQGFFNVLHGVRFLNGTFLLGGGEGQLYRSPDGANWSVGAVGGGYLNVGWHTLAYGDGTYLAGDPSGYVTTSTNGLNWSQPVRRTGASLAALGYINNLFVMFNRPQTFDGLEDQATLKTSPDGVNWTVRSESQTLGVARCELLNGQLVAVGQHAYGFPSPRESRPLVLVSQDGLTWTTGQGLHLREVGGRPEGFMAVGEAGSVKVTAEGSNWEWKASGTLLDLVGLADSGARVVVVGSTYLPPITNGPDAGKNNRFVTSVLSTADFTNWTESNGLGLTPRQTLTAVAYGNGRFMAVGGDTRITGATDAPVLLSSTDGTTWTAGTLPAGVAAVGAFRNIEYVNGLFFLSGPKAGGGKVWLTSPDGSTWTALEVTTSYDFQSVGFLNGRYLVVAGMGASTSTNGTTWAWTNFTGGFRPDFLARAFAGVWGGIGRVRVGGTDFDPIYGASLGSGLDGLAWTQRFADNVESALTELTFANGTWVAVGERGLVVTSTP